MSASSLAAVARALLTEAAELPRVKDVLVAERVRGILDVDIVRLALQVEDGQTSKVVELAEAVLAAERGGGR